MPPIIDFQSEISKPLMASLWGCILLTKSLFVLSRIPEAGCKNNTPEHSLSHAGIRPPSFQEINDTSCNWDTSHQSVSLSRDTISGLSPKDRHSDRDTRRARLKKIARQIRPHWLYWALLASLGQGLCHLGFGSLNGNITEAFYSYAWGTRMTNHKNHKRRRFARGTDRWC